MPMPIEDFQEWYSGWYREHRLSGDFKPDKPSVHKKEPGDPDLTREDEGQAWEDEPLKDDEPSPHGYEGAWRWE